MVRGSAEACHQGDCNDEENEGDGAFKLLATNNFFFELMAAVDTAVKFFRVGFIIFGTLVVD